jgi:hypothetical protein
MGSVNGNRGRDSYFRIGKSESEFDYCVLEMIFEYRDLEFGIVVFRFKIAFFKSAIENMKWKLRFPVFKTRNYIQNVMSHSKHEYNSRKHIRNLFKHSKYNYKLRKYIRLFKNIFDIQTFDIRKCIRLSYIFESFWYRSLAILCTHTAGIIDYRDRKSVV